MSRKMGSSIILNYICHLLIVFLISGSLTNARRISDAAPRSDLCDSLIYCKGELLRIAQLSRVFNDSKSFVDHYQLNDPSVTLANFQKLMTQTNRNPSRDEVKQYLEENFAIEDELVQWSPPDWQENPQFLKRIVDPKFRLWAKDLNDLWKFLAKKISPKVLANPERHSLITVDNGFIVPGGRFQESYYWDSYWVIEGLLLSGMLNTTRGIIENFFSMVNRFGFIPNGARIYYLMRSQPPLLIPMVERYVAYSGDMKFLIDNLPTLEKEFAYFQREKTVKVNKNGETFTMARYVVSSDGPRPESYREDYNLTKNLSTDAEKKKIYEEVKAGAESGWDFSWRWTILPGGGQGNLSFISTSNIIPVDLNAFLQRNARYLSTFNVIAGNLAKAKYYKQIAEEYQRGIDNVLWNEKEGVWLDYDILNSRPRNYFYPTNIAPLYTGSFDFARSQKYAMSAVAYLKRNGVDDFMGGTPTSLSHTGEQWDMPNAWPPLQSIMIEGLRNTGKAPATTLAEELAIRWLRANYLGFSEKGMMYEKYDAENPGKFGGGGEYPVQAGFGWTNGVVLQFLNDYPNATPYDPL